MDKLTALINELESRIPNSKRIALAVSAVAVDWHIQHSLLAFINIIEAAKNSNPQNYKWQFNLKRILVFGMNKIPRGKGQAPKTSQPESVITELQLQKNIEIAKIKLIDLKRIPPNSYFEHPVFGKLNLRYTSKLLKIHTIHHLKIIDDIIKAG
jgi:hypothetical protein